MNTLRLDQEAPLMASGAISYPVAGVYGFDRLSEALEVAGKLAGKAILRPNRT